MWYKVCTVLTTQLVDLVSVGGCPATALLLKSRKTPIDDLSWLEVDRGKDSLRLPHTFGFPPSIAMPLNIRVMYDIHSIQIFCLFEITSHATITLNCTTL